MKSNCYLDFLGHYLNLKPPSDVVIVNTFLFAEYRDVVITWKLSNSIDQVYVAVDPVSYVHIEKNLTHAILGLPYDKNYKVTVAAESCRMRGESYSFSIGNFIHSINKT